MRIVVKDVGNSFKEIYEDLTKIDKDLTSQMMEVGDQAAIKMRSIIADGKVRPQTGEPTKLENNIDVEYQKNGWGVGDIEKLKAKAPHWAAINWGSSHMKEKWLPPGIFGPGNPKPNSADSRTGRWIPGGSTGTTSYSGKVKNPIPAKNYIEKTVNFVRSKILALKLRK